MSTLAAKTPGITKAIIPTCPKCGMDKESGKLSCCYEGGAWFKNCGVLYSIHDHTWTDGVKACKSESTNN